MTGADTETGRGGDAPEHSGPPAPVSSGSGIVSRYRADERFGFIARFGAPDLFFHGSDFIGRETVLETGLRVRFDVEPSQKRPGTFVAVRVRRYDDQNTQPAMGAEDDDG